jgi:predicted nucleic acid-binding protein
MIVVADTSPINYLVLIGEQDLLPALFGQVVIPEAVLEELLSTIAPRTVQEWIAIAPAWLIRRATTASPDPDLHHLDEGERQAIQLAQELQADLLLVDDKAARREAVKRNLPTAGTLGILDRAAEKGLIDFSTALARLKQTSFYISPLVERFFLERETQRRAGGRKHGP